MIYSHWPTGDYPILINPEVHEYESISNQRWDTLRIVVNGPDIGIASGFGNTHMSVIAAMSKSLDRRIIAVVGEDYIFYVEDEKVYSNGELYSGSRKEPIKKTLKCFSETHANMLRDIIQMSGYSIY